MKGIKGMSETRPDYYKTLYEVASDMNSSHDQDTVLNCIVQNVTDAMQAKGCSIILLSSDKKTLMHTVTSGLSEGYIQKGDLSANESISDVLKGEAVAIPDAATDPRVQYSGEKLEEGIASILSVPMDLRGEIIGVVRVYTSERREFTDDDIYFLQAVANLGAIALENARLYAEVRKNYDDLRQEMLEWRTSMAISGTPRSMWFIRHSKDDVFPPGHPEGK